MKGRLFGEGFGSRDAGFKLSNGGKDPGDGGRFNLPSKGLQVEFHDSNNISVAIMQGGRDDCSFRCLAKICLIFLVNFYDGLTRRPPRDP